MCFGGDDPPQAPRNVPSYEADQAKAGAAAATIAKNPAQDDDLNKPEAQPTTKATSMATNSGANVDSLRM